MQLSVVNYPQLKRPFTKNQSFFFPLEVGKKSRLLPSRDGGLNGNKVPARKLQDLKLAFSEYYLSLVLLQNYQNLNYTGFRKILKKHDKMLSTHAGANWRIENVDVANFYINKDIDKLIQDTESKVTNDLEDGDRQKAMKRLRVPPLGDHHSPWTTFKVGLFSGAFIVLLITVIISGISKDYQSEQGRNDWRIVFRLYRGPLLVILFIFLMGVNVYGWRSSGVNHVLIFELDPRNHLSEQHLMEVAAIFGVIWTLSPSLSLWVPFCLIRLKRLDIRRDFGLLRVLGRIATAPFFYVGFADFWIADQLNSLAPAITDLHYLICFYSSPNATIDGKWQVATDKFRCVDSTYWIRSILSCLPAWFRFAQCLRRYRDTKEAFPHLVNAGKYSTTFFVVTFSTLKLYI
ncbi:Xenotropic and polytropic retrovirus receptor 1,Xenotropic and polytropic retrovirus receptor 1 homolog [Lepeophtheirus salmonis]|uniref:Xenotropic and polytropic retrovirus receptor 1,Xenotropic and polytropic retrovirus receptor 1 homolog n=1 Tax=Lepeophtheirus salmonis TaxID=72036 RepID=A0A7R8HAH1_LEPSM|nr:Xenotropic and polytropic retrovirus receptor 1,Xenotropic and polytropic retrovirus receptor 1 homolog [Lepeophtheirus salmonis]CAF2971222.1 Xenotropic and polytropic retrovirus receptor 1,Xenotropic and polytropic retrovirus receptor 1 homolog [Lepeophtheirus salmonis]